MNQNYDATFRPKHSVRAQAILLAGTTGAAQVLTAVMYLLAARSVNPSEFGHVVTAISVGSAVVGFIDFGTNTFWVRELAAGRILPNQVGARIVRKLLVAGLFSVLWAIAVSGFFRVPDLWASGVVACAFLFTQSSQVQLRGAGRGDLVAVSTIIDRVFATLLLVSLGLVGVSHENALWLALVAGSVVSGCLSLYFAPLRFGRGEQISWRTVWSGSGSFGIYGLATSAQALDLGALAAFGGTSAAGIYGAVNRWTQPMGLLVTAFSSASAPYLARAEGARSAWRQIRGSVWLPLSAIALCILVAAVSPLAVRVLIGPQYADSAGVLRVLAIATIPGIVNQPLAIFLQAMHRQKWVATVVTANVLCVLLAIAMIAGSYGALGVAVVALASQSLVAVTLTFLSYYAVHHVVRGTVVR